LGDLGNVNADENGIVAFKITEQNIGLHGNDSIIGRTLSITNMRDDLGLGNESDSKINGHAGQSAAWGVIGIKK
jgi:Cu-Zn family superoxide dismutase